MKRAFRPLGENFLGSDRETGRKEPMILTCRKDKRGGREFLLKR